MLGVTSPFCLSGNCITKLLGAGEGGKRAEKSRSDAHECGWLVSGPYPLSGELLPALCTSQQETHPVPANIPSTAGHPLGRSCNECLTQPSAGSCPPLFYFMQTLPTKPMSCPALGKSPASSLRAGDALPEQDGEGRGREKQCRASLEEPTTKFPKQAQSPRRTHLHVGVARPALRSHQTFCFHDWKGNEMVTSQSSREGIFLLDTALLHRVIPPRGAEPTNALPI